jgi:hypothetical protein
MGIAQQDAACQESMGPIQDRSRERLGTSDVGIIAARDRLLRAALALRERGEAPPGVDPADQHARSAAVLLDRAIPFADAVRDAMTPAAGAGLLSV